MRWIWGLLLLGLGACAGTSYGVTHDGTFPPRPANADYPNWEHICVKVDDSNTSEMLNKSGDKGWQLVTMGNFKGDTLMCFKRPKAVHGHDSTTADDTP